MADHEQLALAFFARWGVSYDEMCASFHELFTEQTVWDQRPIPRLTGPRNAVRFLGVAHRTLGLETIAVDIASIASRDGVVHTERVDHLRRADGGVIVSAPVVGVLRFDGDRIAHWREYFDAAGFTARIVASSARHVVRRRG